MLHTDRTKDIEGEISNWKPYTEEGSEINLLQWTLFLWTIIKIISSLIAFLKTRR